MSLRAVYLGSKTYSRFMEPDSGYTHWSRREGRFPGHVPDEKSAGDSAACAKAGIASAAMYTLKSLPRRAVLFLRGELGKSKL